MSRPRTFTTVLAMMIGGSASLLACPQCFGAEETTLVGGTQLGILVLLAVTLAVQGGFVGFFIYLRKRARSFDAETGRLRPQRIGVTP